VAALLLAIVVGVQIMRQMIGLSTFATCSTRGVDEDIGPVFQQLWTGEAASAERRPPRSSGIVVITDIG
jgi:hypothetical protein